MEQPIVLVGASVRSAAYSAVRAGYRIWALDLFGDLDLRQIAVTKTPRPYPQAVVSAVRRLGSAPVVYTGAWENYPVLLDQLARDRPLLGNTSDTVRAVRDPFRVAGALRLAGLPSLEVRPSAEGLPLDGSWLRKHLRRSGGAGVTPLTDGEASDDDESFYFQRRQEGTACSAVFVAAGGRAEMLGATRQLVGDNWASVSTTDGDRCAGGFRYAGSIGPLPLSAKLENTWRSIGETLAAEFQLRGLFGVDAILGLDTVWPIEVNPRWTASTEVLERGLAQNAMGLHIEACDTNGLPRHDAVVPQRFCGKAILYASRDVRTSEAIVQLADQRNRGATWPTLADIPAAGTLLRRGQPILTVLCAAPELQSVEPELRRLERQVKAIVYGQSVA